MREDWFAGGGEMGALMRATDWSKTKLGPVEQWPRSLRTMLGVVLRSRFPMLLWWGPELLHLYNDAYRPILRDKHPASLAAPAAEVWAEVWDAVAAMAKSVQDGGPASWTEDMQLFIHSGGMAEETYFTFSYSPVPGDDGQVGGLLNTVQETTAKVQSERQIRMLHELSARATEAKSEDEVYRIATDVLSANELDLPFVLIYALDDEATRARLVGVTGWTDYDGPAKPARVAVAADGAAGWPIGDVVRGGHEIAVEDLAARFGSLPAGKWQARPERAIVLPLVHNARSTPHAVLIAGVSPHRTLDDRYRRLFRATADQVTTALANVHAYETERKRAEALAEIDRAKTAFFSNVSHEFRTPLTLMLGPTEDALASPAQALSGEALHMVRRNTLRLMKLVNSLLDFSRIESGRVDASYAPSDLTAMTSYLASSFRSAIEHAGLVFDVACEPLPEPIFIDSDMWERIVLNLLSNALKFTFEGSIGVAVRWRGDHAPVCRRTSCLTCSSDSIACRARSRAATKARGSAWRWCTSWCGCTGGRSRCTARSIGARRSRSSFRAARGTCRPSGSSPRAPPSGPRRRRSPTSRRRCAGWPARRPTLRGRSQRPQRRAPTRGSSWSTTTPTCAATSRACCASATSSIPRSTARPRSKRRGATSRRSCSVT